MVQTYPVLNSRQKELLRTIVIADKPVSYKELSELFKLSTRTIQREIKALKSTLDVFQLKLSKRIGNGFEIKGDEEGKKRLKEFLDQTKVLSAYTPEERQDGIIHDLLLSKEPIKHYVFSKKYGVTEATISTDLDKVSAWLEKGGIKLIRTPGIGVYINGQEIQRRTMLSRLLHKDITFEEWLELFHNKTDLKEEEIPGQLGMMVRDRLLKLVQTHKILDVERVVHHVLKEQTNFELTDRNYVNLIVHLSLMVERIKSGEVIEPPNFQLSNEMDDQIFALAETIVRQLEKVLSISIPKIEVYYIVLHLSGARILNGVDKDYYERDEFIWIELAQSFIRSVEYHLKDSFEGDELLLEGLVSHFAPAFTRLRYGLQIHNPMLEKINERYPEILLACKKACELLTDKTGFHIPDNEVGYLAMHIGAALIRKKDSSTVHFRAIVVCASGLGTSTFLTTRLKTKMTNLKIEAVVSLNQLEYWLKENGEVDILISTINLPFAGDKNVVIVSPFLNKEDQSRIQNALPKIHKPQPFLKKITESQEKSSSVISLAKYGEGMMQVLRNLKIYHHIETRDDNVFSGLLINLADHEKVSDLKKFTNDLEKREQQGGFVIGQLSMVHAKTEGVKELLVVILRTKNPIMWTIDENEQQLVRAVLLLAAPVEAPKEHIEMISEISSMLIEEAFVNTLIESAPDVVKGTLEDVLTKAYEVKAKHSVKEFQGL